MPVLLCPAQPDMSTKELVQKISQRLNVRPDRVEHVLRHRIRVGRLQAPPVLSHVYCWGPGDLDRALSALSDYRPRQPA